MNINSVVVVFIILLVYFILSVSCSLETPQAIQCENIVKLNWLWNLRNNNRCLNIIIGTIFIPKCFFDQIFNSKFLMKMHDLNATISRNILSFQRTNCDNFMIFIQNTSEMFQLFGKTRERVQRFLPFSQLFVISSNPDILFDPESLKYIYENGLYVYMLGHTLLSLESNVLSFSTLRNVLTEEILNLNTSDRKDAIRYFGTYKSHPFLNSKYKRKVFRVSLFNCAPYVVYLSDQKLDGLEYRVVKEVAKNWTIDHTKWDFSSKILDPWATVLGNVEKNVSDVAMCSVWLNLKSVTSYDVSNYVDVQCGTFLVPKPKLVNPATFLYLSFGGDVWCAILITLILISLCFTILARVGKKWKRKSWQDLVYVDFSRSIMDALDVATSHGLEKFPKENSMRTLFNGFDDNNNFTVDPNKSCGSFRWIIVSFLVGVGYSTGYTSLLTKPITTKPIDTLVNFIEHDLHWLVRGTSRIQFSKTLVDSGVDTHIELAKRIIPDNDTTELKVRVTETGNLGVFVKIISNNFITDVDEKTDPKYTLRIMRSCFLHYYTVVALRKYSSYTQYFNEKIRMLHEFGIITHWGSSIEGVKNNFMRPYFTRVNRDKEDPKKISMQNLSGAFWLLVMGLGIATAVLITENFAIYWKK